MAESLLFVPASSFCMLPSVIAYDETYRSNAAEAPRMRRWLLAALVVSVLLHGGLLYYAYNSRSLIEPAAFVPPPPVRVFNMKKVTIPEIEPVPETVKLTEKIAKVPTQPIEIPKDKPEMEIVRVAPQISDLSKDLVKDTPRMDSPSLDSLSKEAPGSQAMDRELRAVNEALLKNGPKALRQPIIPVGGSPGVGGSDGDASANIPGMKSLDDALAQTGPLHSGEKTGMPGGALFEYDSYELRPAAQDQLGKLGLLIERNPQATFSIEGHTDSFGTPDYNQRLSEERAESVKRWLVENMGIASDRIQTRGFGNTKALVPSSKSMEEQAPNRRVEIVVRIKK